MVRRHVFHVLFFNDRGWWIAQCLERNLATSSQDPRDLPSKLETVLKVQIEADQEAGIEPFSTLPQAPRRFWQMFQSAQPWRPGEDVSVPVWAKLTVA